MSIYQFFTPLFALIVILHLLSRLKRGEENIYRVIVWIIVWGAISYLALFPDTVNFLAKITGIKSGINALVFFSIIVLFYLTFSLIVAVENINRKLTEIIRKIALDKVDKRKEVPQNKSK